MPAVVVISGSSGAGKSTLAELLSHKHGSIHFDGDCWTVGRDPVAEAGATITPEDFANAPDKVPEITKLRMEYKDEMLKAFRGSTMDEERLVKGFYGRMVASINEVRAANPGRVVLLSRASYLRQERNVLRKLIGDDLSCLVLCVSAELLATRRLERTKREAAESGKSLEEHVMSYPASMVPGDTPEERLKFLGSTALPTTQEGEADEPDTFNVRITEETSKDEMLKESEDLLGLSTVASGCALFCAPCK
mmetsp:Transcript_129294/g.322289  ORF Transcript_129294/g.322289 Transcript_129294/m.322289 type:complete len:250 (-) Transcript_129294:65-814(-)